MNMKTLGCIIFCAILGIGNAVDPVSRRELIINTLLSRTQFKALSNSGANVGLSTPFALPQGLQGSLNQENIFTRWKTNYGFSFKSVSLEATVKTTFTKRLNTVVEHNKRFDSGLEKYQITIDGYSHLNESEFLLLRTGLARTEMKKLIAVSGREKRNLKAATTTTKKPTTTTTKKPTTTTTKKPTTTTTKKPTTTTTKKPTTTTTKKPTTTTTKKPITTTTTKSTTTTTKKPTTTIPNKITEVTVDFRTSPYYPAVKNQGNCGSCWAFASVAPMEFQINMLNNVSTADLSEQQIVDCDTTNWGCDGGWPNFVYRNFIGNGFGVTTESLYPYTAVKGSCQSAFQKEKYKVIDQRGAYAETGGWGSGTEADLQILVRKGPVVVALYANTNLSGYKTGIFTGCAAGSIPNHAVVVVGFGVENGTAYWIIRNSWGSDWGDNGHFKMQMGTMMCSIQFYYTIPALSIAV